MDAFAVLSLAPAHTVDTGLRIGVTFRRIDRVKSHHAGPIFQHIVARIHRRREQVLPVVAVVVSDLAQGRGAAGVGDSDGTTWVRVQQATGETFEFWQHRGPPGGMRVGACL